MTRQTGETNSQSKLVEKDVLAIRVLYAMGYTPTRIAKMFEVSRETVHKIVSRKIWSHI